MKTRCFASMVTGLWIHALCPLPLLAATFQVTNTVDSGAGSLRQAILDANGAPGEDRIEFHLPAPGPYLVQPLSALPDLRGPVVIDASTQNGFSGRPLIELRGDRAGAADGLRLSGGFCSVRGLVINRFQRAGIRVQGGTNIIQGNFIGTDLSGKLSLGNGDAGVDLFLGAGHNVIGGRTSLDRNVISGNRWGLYILAPQNSVQGNYLGLDVDGVLALGNVTGIALVRTSHNQIGGSLPGEGNVISGNGGSGLDLIGGLNDGPSFNSIEGNFIGLNAAGTSALANGLHGIQIGANATTNFIGGTNPAVRNFISGNLGSGLMLQNSKPGNRILGNYIGADITGTNAVPNLEHGIRVQADGQSVGGPDPGAGNVIAFNGRAGIFAESGTNNLLQANRLFGNGGLGIALGTNGVTPNDEGDADGGANQLQNFPELQSSRVLGDELTIQGTLQSRPDLAYTLEFFANPDCDPSGAGEGFLVLGRTNVTTAAEGAAAFSIVLRNAVPVGWRVTATATDPAGNTSEFSPCLPVMSVPLVVPIFVQHPLSQSAVTGGAVTFSAAITGEPPPFEYEFRRGTLPLVTNRSSEHTVFFTLTNLHPTNAGQYRIVVRSPATTSTGVGSSAANLIVLADADHDGLPDIWEAAFGLDTNNATDALRDQDGDNHTNLQEYQADTNPTNAASAFKLTASLGGPSPDLLLLRFEAMSNKTYTVQRREQLLAGSWSNLLHWVARPTNTLVTLTNPLPPAAAPRSYRLVTPIQP